VGAFLLEAMDNDENNVYSDYINRELQNLLHINRKNSAKHTPNISQRLDIGT
jgi:hypothetical protein